MYVRVLVHMYVCGLVHMYVRVLVHIYIYVNINDVRSAAPSGQYIIRIVLHNNQSNHFINVNCSCSAQLSENTSVIFTPE